MDFEQFFHKELYMLCRKYGLKTLKWWDRTYALVGPDYIILFSGDSSGVVILEYIRRDPQGNLKIWDIGWYFGTKAEDQDRADLLPRRTIVDGWKNNTRVLARVLDRCGSKLLPGGNQWMEDYLRSEYSFVPHDVAGPHREQAEKYI